MFKILQQTFRTGIVTTGYPDAPAEIPSTFRGRPSSISNAGATPGPPPKSVPRKPSPSKKAWGREP